MHIGQRGLDSLERERNKNGIKGEKQALLNRPMARKSKLQETVRLPSLDRHSIKMVMKHKHTASYIPWERRRFLKSLAAVSVGFTLPGYLAEALILTPQVTQG